MFPKPMGPLPPDQDGGVHATIGILSRSNRSDCHEEKKKSLHHENRDHYMQIFLWLVL